MNRTTTTTTRRPRAAVTEGVRAVRGIYYGVLFSLPVWALLFWLLMVAPR